MELANNQLITIPQTIEVKSSPKAFITSNTEEVSLHELKHNHIIPVFVKDNEPLISHTEFIESVWEVASHVYGEGNVCKPVVRVSHPIKGRIPEARNKPAAQLLDDEKTIYYERMMFLMDIPCNTEDVGGNQLILTVGGVKSFAQDNLSNKKGSAEHFKVFAGFQNRVCTNLCVSTDGLLGDLLATNTQDLCNKVYDLLCGYNAVDHLKKMEALPECSLTEKQFAQLIGRCRLYQHLSNKQREGITDLKFGDSQINSVCKDYYKDGSFCRDEEGNINLWRLYNLFTGANKASYIDSFLDRAVNASSFVGQVAHSLQHNTDNWFLS